MNKKNTPIRPQATAIQGCGHYRNVIALKIREREDGMLGNVPQAIPQNGFLLGNDGAMGIDRIAACHLGVIAKMRLKRLIVGYVCR